jgi:hypothetical protein
VNKVITMILFNRPDYTRAVLQALRECDGIEDYLILPNVEPGCEEVVEAARGIDFAECKVTLNAQPLGIARNTYQAWENGFQHGDFIVHIEDDTVPARDCLAYMEHCRRTYATDEAVFSVATYRRESCPDSEYYALARRSAYSCWLVGTWKSRWEWAKSDWSSQRNGYATHLAKRVTQHGLHEIYPLLSRSQNIGAERGQNCPSASWHQQHCHTEHWAGDFGLPPGAYYEQV